jgi:hypothetical protein
MAFKAVDRGCLIMFSSSPIRVTRLLSLQSRPLTCPTTPRYRPEMHHNPTLIELLGPETPHPRFITMAAAPHQATREKREHSWLVRGASSSAMPRESRARTVCHDLLTQKRAGTIYDDLPTEIGKCLEIEQSTHAGLQMAPY